MIPPRTLLRRQAAHNDAETIAEVVEKSGLPCASVQQFMLQGRGTYPDDPHHLYIQPGAGWLKTGSGSREDSQLQTRVWNGYEDDNPCRDAPIPGNLRR